MILRQFIIGLANYSLLSQDLMECIDCYDQDIRQGM